MHPVFLVAALTRRRDVLHRVAEGDDRMRDHGIGQVKKLPLALYPIHLRPCAEPYRTDPQRVRTKADIFSGNRSIHDSVVLGRRKSPLQVAADEDPCGGVFQRAGRLSVGFGHLLELGLFGYDHKRPIPCVHTAGTAHSGVQYLMQLFAFNRLLCKFPRAAAGKKCVDRIPVFIPPYCKIDILPR